MNGLLKLPYVDTGNPWHTRSTRRTIFLKNMLRILNTNVKKFLLNSLSPPYLLAGGINIQGGFHDPRRRSSMVPCWVHSWSFLADLNRFRLDDARVVGRSRLGIIHVRRVADCDSFEWKKSSLSLRASWCSLSQAIIASSEDWRSVDSGVSYRFWSLTRRLVLVSLWYAMATE